MFIPISRDVAKIARESNDFASRTVISPSLETRTRFLTANPQRPRAPACSSAVPRRAPLRDTRATRYSTAACMAATGDRPTHRCCAVPRGPAFARNTQPHPARMPSKQLYDPFGVSAALSNALLSGNHAILCALIDLGACACSQIEPGLAHSSTFAHVFTRCFRSCLPEQRPSLLRCSTSSSSARMFTTSTEVLQMRG